MTDITREPWLFGAPDGLSSDLHTAAELEQAWEAMRERIKELEGDRLQLSVASNRLAIARDKLNRATNILCACKAVTRYHTDDPEVLKAWEQQAWTVCARAYEAVKEAPHV